MPKSTTSKYEVVAESRDPAKSPKMLTIIAKESDLQTFLKTNNNSFALPGVANIGIHFQFSPPSRSDANQLPLEQVVAIVISGEVPNDAAVVLLLASLSKTRVLTGLIALLSDPLISKVMHNIHQTAFWLQCYGLKNPKIVNCIDLQLLYESTVNSTVLNADMLQIATACSQEIASELNYSTHSFQARTRMSEKLQRSMAYSAKLYASCYSKIKRKFKTKTMFAEMTKTRWEMAIINQGKAAIWFDSDADYQPRSLEFLVCKDDASAIELPKLQLQCEIDSLLCLLPSSYRDAICAVKNYRFRLVDICIDVGRAPFTYMGKRQRVLLDKEENVVSKETIDEIIEKIGGETRIGGDNRVGIDGQLHRISVMRSKTNEVYALTMRTGRALQNAACVLTDLLLSDKHAKKSVLILGHPGSGKTTLIRDVARCVSETMENVCIIDTSNEIGGDGLIPHKCVGWARRMMVRSLEAQAGVMVECVQNHTVETLIVDEIGRKAEVLAASTVRQRGPRLIASAHGDFRALIKNSALNGLIGGSQQVTLGDKEARNSNKQKLQTQRAGTPIFDVIVELDNVDRGRCRIIWDVANAVDRVLEGDDYAVETRRWEISTRGVQVLRK
ncbi:hypothetical protein PPTG_18694 [Plasmopara halstedii]|uniref:AAA+ ATPase domain-containing protein n=1 Tax=Plasmopara halstedii TaxID=4781 RepID=A0A0P1B2N8_PLAHL|nr:hypothetical protein PPTG_18694 [Plasmopara halstedii]CEG47690.1 hypothetical protein PPTG_18694 [Plasmopara halstedii]|eukprot:XP_024584059.1 hypothetical protein PPTG_18694 [Plasmopara halstedii]